MVVGDCASLMFFQPFGSSHKRCRGDFSWTFCITLSASMPDRSECHIFSTSPVDSLAVCLCSSGKKPFARTCCDDLIFLNYLLRSSENSEKCGFQELLGVFVANRPGAQRTGQDPDVLQVDENTVEVEWLYRQHQNS